MISDDPVTISRVLEMTSIVILCEVITAIRYVFILAMHSQIVLFYLLYGSTCNV